MNAPSPLTITPNESGLTVAGEVDAHTAPSLAAAITDCDGEIVVLDLEAVDFVDSSGLRVFIEAHQSAEESGRTFRLWKPSPAVSRLLEISGVREHLHVVE